jgi:predicted PurR-regulated permease PerM
MFRWGLYGGLGVLAVAATTVAVYTTRAVLVRVLTGLFIAVALDPAVNMLTRRGMRRSLAVLVIFVIAAGLTAAFLISVIPALVHQFQALVHDFPGYIASLSDRSSRFRQLTDRYHLTSKVEELIASLPGRLGGGALGFTRRLFGALFDTLTVVVFTIYFMADMPRLRQNAIRLFPKGRRAQADRVADVMVDKVGSYTVVLAALLTTELWPTTVIVVIFFVVYQQVENYFIAPRILRSTISLSAPAVLLSGLCRCRTQPSGSGRGVIPGMGSRVPYS